MKQLSSHDKSRAPFGPLAQRLSHFGSQVALIVMTNLALGGLGLFTGVMTARQLGPVGRGELEAILLWGSFLVTVALWGLSDAVIYFSSRDPQRAGRYWGAAIGCVLVCGVPTLLCGIWFLLPLLKLQSPTVMAVLPWFCTLFFLLFSVSAISLGAIRGAGDFVGWNGVRILPQIGWVIAVVAVAMSQHASAQLFATGFLAAYAVATVVAVVKVFRCLSIPLSLEVKLWPELLRYGLPSVCGSMPGSLLQGGRIVQLVVASLLDPAILGFLAVGIALGDLMRVIPGAITAVVFPRVAGATNERRVKELTQGTRSTVLLTGVCVVLAIVTSPVTVPLLFGPEFSTAVPLAMIMAVAGGMEGLKMVLAGGVRGFGYPSAIVVSEGVGVVFSVLLLFLLLPLPNGNGAALALVGGNLAATILLIRTATHLASCSVAHLILPSKEDVRMLTSSLQRGWGILQATVARSS